jgi:hypothetical protein
MSASPTPQPQQQDDPGAGDSSGASPAQQQANPLQQTLAQLAKVFEQMAQQNPLVQGELMEARTACVKALQKTMMAGRPQQPQGPSQ